MELEPEFIPVPDSDLVPEPDLDPKQNGIKCQKIKKIEANFLGNNDASNIEKHWLFTFFVEELCLILFGTVTGAGTGTGTTGFQSRTWNRNKSWRFHNTELKSGRKICYSDPVLYCTVMSVPEVISWLKKTVLVHRRHQQPEEAEVQPGLLHQAGRRTHR